MLRLNHPSGALRRYVATRTATSPLHPKSTNGRIRLQGKSQQRRFQQSEATPPPKTSVETESIATRLPPNATPQERQAYLHRANSEMERYHHTRELLRQGKLPSKNNASNNNPHQQAKVQLAVVGVFLVAFLSTPMLGRRIATDEEFRKKYIPSWYDWTVQKPENAWTREELHEQMIAVQTDLRERAIRGEFTAEKLQAMQRSLQGLDYPSKPQVAADGDDDDGENAKKRTVPAGWDKIHPGLADDEPVNEE